MDPARNYTHAPTIQYNNRLYAEHRVHHPPIPYVQVVQHTHSNIIQYAVSFAIRNTKTRKSRTRDS